ncbi:MAG TPA: hypothetical protein VE175_04425, partial [Woeseiaceae bacterium]|nr:hypothetical protein [Woeseiaceae bacterium]
MRFAPALFRILLALGGLVAFAVTRARVAVCEDPGEDSYAAVTFIDHEHSSLHDRPGSTNQQNQDFDFLVASASGRFAWGFGHRYLIFDFADIDPQTNGHLHTSFVPLHWRFGAHSELRFSTAIALSASSNVIGHPQEYESETSQLMAALVATRGHSDTLTFRYGICGDHRFGEYAIYPTLGIAWRFSPGWLLDLGFPYSLVRYDATENLRSTLG